MRVGSTPGVVAVLAQVDRSPGQDTSKGNWYGTRRYYVTRGTDPRKINSRLLADLGPTNTGDPRVLERFIRFGAQGYPTRATALVLLNHGSGVYVPPEMRSPERKPFGQEGASSPAARRRQRPIFHPTRERLLDTAPQAAASRMTTAPPTVWTTRSSSACSPPRIVSSAAGSTWSAWTPVSWS